MPWAVAALQDHPRGPILLMPLISTAHAFRFGDLDNWYASSTICTTKSILLQVHIQVHRVLYR